MWLLLRLWQTDLSQILAQIWSDLIRGKNTYSRLRRSRQASTPKDTRVIHYDSGAVQLTLPQHTYLINVNFDLSLPSMRINILKGQFESDHPNVHRWLLSYSDQQGKLRGARGPVSQGSPQTYRILKFVVGSLGLDSVVLVEGNIPYPRYQIWEWFHSKWQSLPIVDSRGAHDRVSTAPLLQYYSSKNWPSITVPRNDTADKERQKFCPKTKENKLASTCLWRWNRQNVPKRRHINSRRRVITQKKAHNIQNTAKAWNKK